MAVLRTLWARWKALARRIGHVQTMILLSLIYHTAIALVWAVTRLKGEEPLGLRRPDGSTYWVPLGETTATLERARKQF